MPFIDMILARFKCTDRIPSTTKKYAHRYISYISYILWYKNDKIAEGTRNELIKFFSQFDENIDEFEKIELFKSIHKIN
jgi:hypothetical protein